MKKLIAYILLVTLCLGLFAGCAEKPAETTPTENSDLSNARAYIFNMYKGSGSKDEAQVLTKDFEVVSAVPVGGVSYSITWTVEVTAGAAEDVAIVDGNNGAKKVDINEKPEEQLDFTLTATVSDAAGNKESVSFKYTVAAVEKPTGDEQVGTLAETIANGDKVIIYYPTETVAIANKAAGSKMDAAYAVVTDTTIKAVGAAVLVVTVDGNGNYTFTCGGKYLTAGATGNSLTLEDNASDYSLWALEEAENGWYIKNVNAAYNGNPQYIEFYSGFTTYGFNDTKKDIYTFQFYKTDAESVLPEKVEAPSDPKQIVDDAFALEEGSALPYDATLTGVITSIDTAWSDDYKNITVSITVTGSNGEKTISCFRLKAGDATTTDQAAALAVGDTITVSGIIKNYQGTVQFDAGCKLDAVTPGAGADENPTEDPTEPTEPEEDPTDPTEPEEDPTEPEEDPTEPSNPVTPTGAPFKNGDKVVIYAPAYNMALSTEKTGYYNVGVEVSVSNGTVSGYGATEVFTVIDNGDGTWSFAYDGQNLGLAEEFTSMNLGTVNDKWEVIDLGNGLYNVRNIGRDKYLEWYDSYSNWSTYSPSDPASDGKFQIAFAVVG